MVFIMFKNLDFHDSETHLLLATPSYFKRMMGNEEAPYGFGQPFA